MLRYVGVVSLRRECRLWEVSERNLYQKHEGDEYVGSSVCRDFHNVGEGLCVGGSRRGW